MAHIRYGDRNYPVANDRLLEIMSRINEALKNDEVLALALNERLNDQDYPSTVYITRGVPVSLHGWNTDAP